MSNSTQIVIWRKLQRNLLTTVFTGIFSIWAVGSFANPVLNNVAAGNVAITQTTNSTVVNQSSPKAIMNWNSFNIDKQQSVHFQQPAGGVALNRINPQQGVSKIYGSLTATGQIILVNPAGIYFGSSAYVNVGGLIATTSNITNQHFLNNQYEFSRDTNYSGSIVNEGVIIAANHGLIALVGANIENNGYIQANLGQVILASGNAFTVSFSGNDLISFNITSPASKGSVIHTGSIIADGGKILISAKSASSVLDNVINLSGVLQAKSVSARGGEIIISGSPNQDGIRIAGTIDASGKKAGERGGKVNITGYQILIDSPALIDVSGYLAGGTINIGGNYHGAGPLPNANAVFVAQSASLLADALSSGSGGNIIVWSDSVTKVHGLLSAKGGMQSGDGGFIETSSRDYLDVSGIVVDTRANAGKSGIWLLDPRSIIVANALTSGGSFISGTNAKYFIPNANGSIIYNVDIQNNLANSDVIITTGSTGTESGDITVNAPISWSNTNTLTLSAFHDINVNNTISNLAGGGLSLIADNTGTGSGTIHFSGSTPQINFAGGGEVSFFYNPDVFPSPNNYAANVNVSAGSTFVPYMLVNTVTDLQNISVNLTGNYALNRNIDASETSTWDGGLGFMPIGVFAGTLNGNNHSIANLFINRPVLHVGLFSFTSGAMISNLSIVDASITGSARVGILAGWANNGTIITNVHTSGLVSGGIVVGGIAGILGDDNPSLTTSVIRKSSNSATVLGSEYVGGIAGTNNAPIESSYNTGNVNAANYLGGVSGWNFGAEIMNTFNSGTINGSYFVGGLVGINEGPVSTSFNVGLVVGEPLYTSGLVAANYSTVVNSYWDVESSGQLTSDGGTGLTTEEIKNPSNLVGIDASSGWVFVDGELPVFQWYVESLIDPAPVIPPPNVPPTVSGPIPAVSSTIGNNNATQALAAQVMLSNGSQNTPQAATIQFSFGNNTVQLSGQDAQFINFDTVTTIKTNGACEGSGASCAFAIGTN